MTESAAVVLYEERDGVAFVTLNKLLINQAYENMGLRTTQLLGTLFDGVTRHTEEAYQWVAAFGDKGFRDVIRDRDRPWGDYGERAR